MCCPKRFIVVGLGFLGLLVSIGYRAVFALVMVDVIKNQSVGGKGASVPALSGVIAAWAPRTEKTRMITISYSGAYLSPTLAFLVTGYASCYVSWHASLFIYGGCGVLWSLAWFFCIYDSPADHPGVGDREKLLFIEEGPGHRGGNRLIASGIPWQSIFTSLPMYAIIVGSFCRNWIFSLILTELPQYFHDVFNASIDDIGWMTGVPEVFMTLVTVTGGVLVDKTIKSRKCGITTTVGRKMAQCIGFGTEAICFFVLATLGNTPENRTTAFILLCIGVGFSGFAISGYQVNPLDLAPQYASILTGLSRCGALGAILSTAVAAVIRGKTGSVNNWQTIFWIAGGVHMAGVIFYGIFARGTRQDWAKVKEGEGLINPVGSESDMHTESREHIYSKSADYGSTRREEEDYSDNDKIFSQSVDNGALRRSDYDEGDNWFLLTI
ncbi:vesicular glutamate transporter 1-like isoform X2 [Pecten maximus]|uniref:vesicular glutamate transporter 1-like isoform X2 n=1 Tax=Pecten maximus TaxID=6579 RepID=UPI00145831B2|nr:vesicular glutamate transporter 1-like isoform X2 [Pecten maximus]